MKYVDTARYYFSETERRFQQTRFNKAVIDILKLPPVSIKTTGPMVLSMVQHKDVLPYLAALKSFASYVDLSAIVIVADKSITLADKSIFSEQIPGVVVRDAKEFVRENIPSGGCWERLVAISQYVGQNYVIQMDADTLTISAPSEVIIAVKDNTSFTLGTYDLQAKVGVQEVARWAQSHCDTTTKPHIQLICESKLLAIAPEDACRFYIRGCAGFAGFGCRSFTEADVQKLSSIMSGLIGDKWSSWGTEQFASNYLISNVDKSIVLPHPVYTTPDKINHTTNFIHFIGPLRYNKGKYLTYLNKFFGKNR